MEITSYSIQSKKLKALLKIIDQEDRKEAGQKVRKYGGFRTIDYEIERRYKWIDEKCKTFYELKPRGRTNYLKYTELAQRR